MLVIPGIIHSILHGGNMATYTTHYNLTKPSTTDKVNISDLNGNADIIDNAIYAVASGKREIVTITFPAGTGSTSPAVKLSDYPTGFTKDNTMVLGAVSFNSSGVGISWNGASKYSSIWTILLKDDGIYGEWDNRDINGAITKITLMKI